MLNARDAALFFYNLSVENNYFLTASRVHALLVISQARFLRSFDQPLFSEPVFAGQFGPFVGSVPGLFRKAADGRLTLKKRERGENLYNQFVFPGGEMMPVGSILEEIWAQYKKVSGKELSEMLTRPDGPWDVAVQKNGGYRGVVPHQLLRLLSC